MKWATALFGDPALTILAIFVGSDATQVKICGSAHPIYISLGNFLDSFRLTGEAWQTSGLVPRLDHSLMQEKGYHNKVFGERAASRQARSRREQQLFQACAWTVLKSLVDVVHEGGRYIAARRGLGLKALPLVSAWNTNREVHNLIAGAHPHTCFHCKVPAHLKDTVGEWPLRDSTCQGHDYGGQHNRRVRRRQVASQIRSLSHQCAS